MATEPAGCWTCGKCRCFGQVEHMVGRLRWAVRTARHAKPKTRAARLRLLWHDFVIHGLLHRGTERCQDCGRDYPAWHADDTDWQRAMGGPGGLLCASCFGVRCAT